MLANRYFIERDWTNAIPLLEEVLAEHPDRSAARKKLIICYTQIGRLSDALDAFVTAIERDPRSIIDTPRGDEDCPCPKLTSSREKRLPYENDRTRTLIELGILESYCDLEASRSYWREVAVSSEGDPRIPRILQILEKEAPACRVSRK
jgi:tetratricopeptide (TPR) repeat protein